MEPGHYTATRQADGSWAIDGVCGHCREPLTQYDNPVVIHPRVSFDPPDYKQVILPAQPDSGIFHARCAQSRYRDNPDRLPEHLRPRQVTVWPNEWGVTRGDSFPW